MDNDYTKILRSVTVSLTPEELTKIVKSYLEKEGFEVHDVEFKSAVETKGYGMGEYQVTTFKGCSATCRITTNRHE